MEYDITQSLYFKVADKLLVNMETQQENLTRTSVLLSGDPGVGKTSFVRTFCQLLGLNLITIEVPHIVEEHIINIPFVVFNPVKGETKNSATRVKTDDSGDRFDIELADSHLISEIRSKQKVPDSQYIAYIRSLPKNIQDLYESFGGTNESIPDDFKVIRDNYTTVLFLDEFFRKTSTNIRNMLRTILNGKIGLDDIPEGTYVIYASNLADEGLEDIPKNVDFYSVDIEAPTYDEWINYIAGKYGIEDDMKGTVKDKSKPKTRKK